MIAYYLKQDAFAFDVETVGDRRGDTPVNEVLWISFATYGRTDVIPMGHPNGDLLEVVKPLTGQGEKRVAAGLPARDSDYSRDVKKATKVFAEPPAQLYPAEVFEALKPLLFNENILTIGHNLIFDLTSVAKYYGGDVPPGPYFDTMVGSFIYDNRNKNQCNLAACLKRELGFEMEKGVGAEVEKYSFQEVALYAYLDAEYTWLLWKKVQEKITANEVQSTMNLEMAVLRVLCSMKLTGAPIDMDALVELDTHLEKEIEKAKANIFKIAGRQFNLNSNAEKQDLLFGPKSEGGRGLKPKLLTGKGKTKSADERITSDYSVSEEALTEFKGQDPLVDAMLQYADLNKLYGTYVIPYLGGDIVRTTAGKAKVETKDSLLINGRIHCDFIQHGAETGRFSSRNPNLQNVPAPNTPNGKAIRNLFYAPKGYKLVVADYSQIEPRVIASLSKDETMIQAYREKRDIYTAVGDKMGVDRKAGKELVLSIAYGVGADKIARKLGCSTQEARDLLESFGKEFPDILTYKSTVVKYAKQQTPVPYIKTMMGRKRFLPMLASSDKFEKSGAERQAFNTRIQGTAADIIKWAMVRAYEYLPKEAKMILTVHDELVTLTPDSLVDQTVEAIRTAMEDIKLLDVPLVADIKVVDRWGDAK
jgi:DNA polymerase I-like protein with 3'-5' exonuclease and polymerase domains